MCACQLEGWLGEVEPDGGRGGHVAGVVGLAVSLRARSRGVRVWSGVWAFCRRVCGGEVDVNRRPFIPGYICPKAREEDTLPASEASLHW